MRSMLTAQHQGPRQFARKRQRTVEQLRSRALNTRLLCNSVDVTGNSYDDIVDQLARRALYLRLHPPSSGRTPDSTAAPAATPGRLVVGIAGAPGSGKTTLAAAVAGRLNELWTDEAAAQFPADSQSQTVLAAAAAAPGYALGGRTGGAPLAAVMPMDGFHYYRRELDAMPNPAEAHARRGAPWTFNAAKFVEAVRRVRLEGAAGASGADVEVVGKGVEVLIPSFDHGVGDPVEEDIMVAADTAVVLVEGNYLLLDQEPWHQLRELFDETWFVSTPMDVIRQRLFERQTAIGLAPEVSRERIRSNDLPNAELVVASAGAATLRVAGWVPPRV